MKSLKITFGLICLAILAGNIVTMSRWNEARGVHDDICRQAHLFQRFGIGGLNTNAALDDELLFFGNFSAWSRKLSSFVQGLGFGVAVLVGMALAQIAEAIIAGSPLATTDGSADVVAPAFSLTVLGQHLRDMQFVLIVLAIGATAWLLRTSEGGARQVGLVAAGSLMVNLILFLSHPVFTPYYIVPIAMLTLCSTCFAALMQPVEASEALPLRHWATNIGALSR
jgi:hypothetical protein